MEMTKRMVIMDRKDVSRFGEPASDLGYVLKMMMEEGMLVWCTTLEWFPKAGTYADDSGFYVHHLYLLHLLHRIGYSKYTSADLERDLLADKLIVTGPNDEAGVLLRIPNDKALYPAYCLHMANIYDAASYIEEPDDESAEWIEAEVDELMEMGLLW